MIDYARRHDVPCMCIGSSAKKCFLCRNKLSIGIQFVENRKRLLDFRTKDTKQCQKTCSTWYVSIRSQFCELEVVQCRAFPKSCYEGRNLTTSIKTFVNELKRRFQFSGYPARFWTKNHVFCDLFVHCVPEILVEFRGMAEWCSSDNF